jgi:hypothetical protein
VDQPAEGGFSALSCTNQPVISFASRPLNPRRERFQKIDLRDISRPARPPIQKKMKIISFCFDYILFNIVLFCFEPGLLLARWMLDCLFARSRELVRRRALGLIFSVEI